MPRTPEQLQAPCETCGIRLADHHGDGTWFCLEAMKAERDAATAELAALRARGAGAKRVADAAVKWTDAKTFVDAACSKVAENPAAWRPRNGLDWSSVTTAEKVESEAEAEFSAALSAYQSAAGGKGTATGE